MNAPFLSAMMTLTDSAGNEIARDLPCQIDSVNTPWNMEVQGMIPTDWFDIYSRFWTAPVPTRGNYFVDQTTKTKYQVFSSPNVYLDHLEMRCTRYSGTTP